MLTQVTLLASMPLSLGEGRAHLALAVARRRAERLAFEVLGLGERLVLAAEDVERRLVEHHADRLDASCRAPSAAITTRGVGEAGIGAAGVDLGDRVARALGVLQRHVEALGLVVALVERDPVGGVVADREPVEREGELLLRRGAAGRREQRGAARVTMCEFMHVLPFLPRFQSIQLLGPRRPAAATAPRRRRTAAGRAIEIQTSAANATGVFMLLCVVTMT